MYEQVYLSLLGYVENNAIGKNRRTIINIYIRKHIVDGQNPAPFSISIKLCR
jgi:hypothetical protein